MLVRGKEPSLGKLDLPGGFVDPGEGMFEGLMRELREELGWEPPVPSGVSLTEVFTLFASFPNVYPYKKFDYNTCDMYFTISVPDLTEKELRLHAAEISAARFMHLDEIKSADIAFDSTRRAIEVYKAYRKKMEF